MTKTREATPTEWAREIKATDAARDKRRGFRGRPTSVDAVDEIETESGEILLRPGTRQPVAAPSTRAVEPSRIIDTRSTTVPKAAPPKAAPPKSAPPKPAELQPAPGIDFARRLREQAEAEAHNEPPDAA